MENKWPNAGNNSIMEGYVKTDDIFKDMCGLLSPHKSRIPGGKHNPCSKKLAPGISDCQ